MPYLVRLPDSGVNKSDRGKLLSQKLAKKG